MRLFPGSIFILLFSIGLAGCRAPPATPQQPMTEQQVTMLVSMMAGTQYLRQQCNRSDLPGDALIEQAAYRTAQRMNWGRVDQQRLTPLSQQLYQALLQDSTPQEIQCAEFNRLLVPFIDTLRLEKG